MQSTIYILQKIEYLAKNNSVVLLAHANSAYERKVIAELAAGRVVIDLSDPALRERATWQPQEFLQRIEKPALLMNLQYAPRLVPYMTNAPAGSYLAAASQMYYLSEALRGVESAEIVNLPLGECSGAPFWPCVEYLCSLRNGVGNVDVLHNIFTGSIAGKNFASDDERKHFFTEYLKGFLQRDIQDLTTASDAMKFYRFLCAVAAETGNMVNYAMLGKAADVSSPTAKTWMAFLEGAGIVRLLWPISHPALKRIAKAPKIYFADTGLAAYLLRINREEELSGSAFFTALFETYVVNRILESYWGNGLEVKLSYLRDSNAKEINLLLQYEGAIYPIEIKKDNISPNKLAKKFNALAPLRSDESITVGNGCVITLGSDVSELDNGLWQVGAGKV